MTKLSEQYFDLIKYEAHIIDKIANSAALHDPKIWDAIIPDGPDDIHAAEKLLTGKTRLDQKNLVLAAQFVALEANARFQTMLGAYNKLNPQPEPPIRPKS